MKEQVVDLIFTSEYDAMEAKEAILGFKEQPQDITNNGAELRLTFESRNVGYDWFNENFAALGKLPQYKDEWEDNPNDAEYYGAFKRAD